MKQVSNHKNIDHQLKVASLNICRGLYSKEELLEATIRENDFDVCSVCEVDIENFDIKNPFSLGGYQTFFPLERTGTSTKRLICFVKEDIQVTQRSDLMSDMFSSDWLEIRNNGQKILICTAYCEFSDLTNKDQMSINQQHERWKIFRSQVEKASKESFILCLGDFNIDLEKWENSTYYQKNIAQDYQMMLGMCGLKISIHL